jgi:hypothetical protein
MAERPPAPHDSTRDETRTPAGPRPVPTPIGARPRAAACSDAMACDRCRTPMFRMHAVWRCPACGYKTDCCGW